MKNTKLPTIKKFKEEAKELRKNNPTITVQREALDILARQYGYNQWREIGPYLLDT